MTCADGKAPTSGSISDPITIGLSTEAMDMIDTLSGESGIFREALDAYRFAIALAIAHNVDPESVIMKKRQTKYNVGSLDPNKRIFEAIRSLTPVSELPPYRRAERLAEWGIKELYARLRSGKSIRDIQSELKSLSDSSD